MAGLRFGVRSRLVLAFSAMAAMTLVTSAVAILSFSEVEARFIELTTTRLPAMAAATKLSQQAESIVAQAPALVAASSPTELHTIDFRIRDQLSWLAELIERVRKTDGEAIAMARVDDLARELERRFVDLATQVERRLSMEALDRQTLGRLLVLGRTITGIRDQRETEGPPEDAAIARRWAAGAQDANTVLIAALATTDAAILRNLGEAFGDLLETAETESARLSDPLSQDMRRSTAELRHLGLGEAGIFNRRQAHMDITRGIQGTLTRNRLSGDLLSGASSQLADRIAEEAVKSALVLRAELHNRGAMMIVLSLFGVFGAGIVLLHLQRTVLRRLATLRAAMTAPLSTRPLVLEGSDDADEIGDMARALKGYAQAIADREHALRQSEGRFRAMATNVPGVLFQWFWRPLGEPRFLYVSPRCQDLFGVSPALVLADWRKLGFSLEDQRAWVVRAAQAARDSRDWIQEGRIALANGGERWWRVVAAPTPGEEPDTIILNGVLIDITALKDNERDLRAARQQAEQALSDLRSTQDTLVQAEKLASLGQLVAGIAHEINTPLGTGITGATFLDQETRQIAGRFRSGTLRRSELADYMERAEETARLIFTNLSRAGDLVQSFKQVAVDQVSDDRRTFALDTYIDEIFQSLNPRLRQTRLTVERAIEPGLMVDGYPGVLFRILSNLVMNTLMHGFEPHETGTIRVEARLLPDSAPGRVELVYFDTGKGIPHEIQGRVFDPFFTTRRGQGGTGLGLNIVYNLVTQSLGGTMTLSSHPGTGTTFTVVFPIKAPRGVQAVPSPQPIKDSGAATA
ncbi:sensor histidine kinase [Rhodospirillum rubrum]|uniref:histidine kinase n=1 Tax=Rhodospirillum rubrum (strain ATCC 11170 / ATH 1.1.1 / DSM 467 / LMG 4362 / NCIMB 8255 / S1) TaxID=269796 RepID=Q2RRC9_RHORT|nr:HAMP domain-containing sensor histidine kinase [Rhodospirillum rubrum]ABC23316.1 multi-sensor signal transduction histidine kinase [Rhodospirillum rubrum ATCC 11170]MBK5954932.1 PAS domain-containing sensor histidine kinase [Rhodospirillum rubrum]QXG79289.1 PAS domain-containing sensor histidine kinase [Rhodospirillum rubrum]HCF19286.1 PAS domain-containing sensor histidine kinase [Rhodospirillum rubrum]